MNTMKANQTMFGFSAELDRNLSVSHDRFAAAHWFGGLFHLRVLADIWTDIKRCLVDIKHTAREAAREDMEAAKLIHEAMADGLDHSDVPAIKRALRLIQSSAKRDHSIATTASQN